MRLLVISALAAILFAPLPSLAAEPAAVTVEPEPEARLDALFRDLRRTGDERSAERLAGRIRAEWQRSGSATIDLLMNWADEAAKKRNFAAALDFLDQVVVLEPGFAEGWNRRASVHFAMNNHGQAMADIDRTLRLEPRHFGALAGMADMLKRAGRKERALEAYMRVLEVYPMLRSAQREAGALADDLAGEGI